MSVARKTWTDGNGAPWTHGQIMRGWWAERGRDPEFAPDRDCAGALEMRGDRVIDDDGTTVVHWYGSFTHVILYCASCQAELDDVTYVTSVPRALPPGAASPGPGGSPMSADNLW